MRYLFVFVVVLLLSCGSNNKVLSRGSGYWDIEIRNQISQDIGISYQQFNDTFIDIGIVKANSIKTFRLEGINPNNSLPILWVNRFPGFIPFGPRKSMWTWLEIRSNDNIIIIQ